MCKWTTARLILSIVIVQLWRVRWTLTGVNVIGGWNPLTTSHHWCLLVSGLVETRRDGRNHDETDSNKIGKSIKKWEQNKSWTRVWAWSCPLSSFRFFTLSSLMILRWTLTGVNMIGGWKPPTTRHHWCLKVSGLVETRQDKTDSNKIWKSIKKWEQNKSWTQVRAWACPLCLRLFTLSSLMIL